VEKRLSFYFDYFMDKVLTGVAEYLNYGEIRRHEALDRGGKTLLKTVLTPPRLGLESGQHNTLTGIANASTQTLLEISSEAQPQWLIMFRNSSR